MDGFYKRLRAAIQNGQFEIVELNHGVVDPAPDERGQQMLGGGNQHAFFHQAGGVTDACDVSARGLNLKAVKIRAPKLDA